jgi:16S rRNA (adenine1518-N6/adenine1519-N6)-dimethyltransferase
LARQRLLGRRGESLRPDKRLGQHFLVNPEIPNRIVSLAGFAPSDVVVEIGPGRGALTFPLSKAVSRIVAIEKDARLANRLRERLTDLGIRNVTVVCEDILRSDLDAIFPPLSGKIQIIGNLPYNISSPVLEKLIRRRDRLDRAVLMFQKEVADRLTAVPGAKGYGALTVMIRYHARTKRLLPVSRTAFYPVPKVDSMVVEVDFGQPYPCRGVEEADFRKTVKSAFAHRRKTLLNSLKASLPGRPPGVFLKGMAACGIDPERRAETLDMDAFLCLASIWNSDIRIKKISTFFKNRASS